MTRRALIVGINQYDNARPLTGCVKDAQQMQDVLGRHENGDLNYECRLIVSPGRSATEPAVTRGVIRQALKDLFAGSPDAALFYFAGHGSMADTGGVLMSQDACADEPGIPMDELITLANGSGAREVLLILDCCHSGALGNLASLQGGNLGKAVLREGVTILAASAASEKAAEVGGQGMFSAMVLHALHGGAADVQGKVSAVAVYAHVDQALGAWDQRPIYKSHATRLTPVRRCEPAVADSLLRLLPNIFPDPVDTLQLDPSYEHTHPSCEPDHVAVFNNLKLFRNARMVRAVQGDDLYYAALNSNGVRLTGLGRFYWHLAANGRI